MLLFRRLDMPLSNATRIFRSPFCSGHETATHAVFLHLGFHVIFMQTTVSFLSELSSTTVCLFSRTGVLGITVLSPGNTIVL